jgi:hypothetical protein
MQQALDVCLSTAAFLRQFRQMQIRTRAKIGAGFGMDLSMVNGLAKIYSFAAVFAH